MIDSYATKSVIIPQSTGAIRQGAADISRVHLAERISDRLFCRCIPNLRFRKGLYASCRDMSVMEDAGVREAGGGRTVPESCEHITIRFTGHRSRQTRTLLVVQPRQSPTSGVVGRVEVRVAAGHALKTRPAAPRSHPASASSSSVNISSARLATSSMPGLPPWACNPGRGREKAARRRRSPGSRPGESRWPSERQAPQSPR